MRQRFHHRRSPRTGSAEASVPSSISWRIGLRRLARAHHDPALNGKLVRIRRVFLGLAAGFTALIGLLAASNQVSTLATLTGRLGHRAPIYWHDAPARYGVYVLSDFLVAMGVLLYVHSLVARLVEHRHGSGPLFGRRRYPH